MKSSKKSAKNSIKVWAAVGVILVAAVIIAVVAVVTNKAIISHKTVGVDEEFLIKPGQTVYLSELGNTPLKLDSIVNGMYIDNDNDPNQIIFSWEGQIYYHFIYDGSEIVVGSALEADVSRPLSSIFTLDYVAGDENSGTFILRKVAE